MARTLFAYAIILIIGEITNSYAAENREDYELQERCGKRASEIFKQDNGNKIANTADGQAMTGYTNHYHKKLNKCFVLQTTTSFHYKDKEKKKTTSTLINLYDVNENKDYGTFFKDDVDQQPFQCYVLEAVCHSEAEWDALIKPYMQE